VLREFNAPEFQRELAVLRKAAESGEIADLLAVAKRLSGMGEQADREAFGWYLKAAEKGSPEAMLRVGVLSFHGLSAPADKVLAKSWLERAIQAGQPDAAAVLRMLFEDSK
jgi:TPR repeat protein